MVADSPSLFAEALSEVATTGHPSPRQHQAVEVLWYVVDVLRLGTERLWSLVHDPAAGLPAWDPEALARLRAGGPLSARVGLIAYREAVAQWVGAARPVLDGRADPGSDAGAATEVVRGNAHDAQHHLLELERLAAPSPAGLFVAAPASEPGWSTPVLGDAQPLFDQYVMVDWSANSTPRTGRDSIWIAAGAWRRGTLQVGEPSNPPTRHDAMDEIGRIVDGALAEGHRVVVGFDFPLAYPAGLTRRFPAVFGPGPPWRAMWRTLTERIEDGADNANNRFEVAAALNRDTGCRLFWGCPSTDAGRYLAINDKPVPGLVERGPGLQRFRLTERRAQQVGSSIQSVWKLAYAGSVGSQSLLGIPRLEAMRTRYGDGLGVWPFEPVTAASGPEAPPVVLAEIWPTVFAPDTARHPVRDAAQVLEVVSACAEADRRGELPRWLSSGSPDGPPEQAGEEGWILGVR